MRITLLLLFISLTFTSCKVTEMPEFKEVKNLKIIDTSIQNFTLQADILFSNPNNIGGTLQANDIHIFVDDIDVATIESDEFKVQKKNEFTMPLKTIIPFEKVFNDNKQTLLNNIMNVITKKNVTIRYAGKIRYSLGLFHYDYPLSYKQELSLRKGK